MSETEAFPSFIDVRIVPPGQRHPRIFAMPPLPMGASNRDSGHTNPHFPARGLQTNAP